MAKYRKKPVEVEAVQWTGKNDTEIVRAKMDEEEDDGQND